MCGGHAAVMEFDNEPADRETFKRGVRGLVAAISEDFRLTNSHLAGRGAKVAAGLLVGGAVATELGAMTPLKWALSKFGALPWEFTSSGSIQVFQLSWGARLGQVALAAGVKFVLVTLVFEGGVLIGSIVNQALPEESKNAIGGAINEIINEGGWELLWEHPFGVGM